MKKLLFYLFLMLSTGVLNEQRHDLTIHFDSAAGFFTESLPLGNGRLGALVYGNTRKERIALNEISLWSGGPQQADRDSAWAYLKPIQDLLRSGKNREAQELLIGCYSSLWRTLTATKEQHLSTTKTKFLQTISQRISRGALVKV